MFDWLYIDLNGIVPEQEQAQTTPPTFHATTECPNPWPGLIVAFVLGVVIARTWKR
jgi:hypothetical protein